MALILAVMGVWFGFDSASKVLLVRLEGRLTEAMISDAQQGIRQYSAAIEISAGIYDFSPVTQFGLSTPFIQSLARQEPSMVGAATRPRIIVSPATEGFGLSRMFQVLGERSRPLLQVVRTLDEAFVMLGIQSPHFEPLESPPA